MFKQMKLKEFAYCKRETCQKKFRKIIPNQKFCDRRCAQESALIAYADRLRKK